MVLGDLKMGQIGTNSIIVMTLNEISCIPKTKTVTYACVVVDFCPQKAAKLGIQIFSSYFWDPHWKQNSDSMSDLGCSGRIFF